MFMRALLLPMLLLMLCAVSACVETTGGAGPPHRLQNGVLSVFADDGELRITAHTEAAIEVQWLPADELPPASFAIAAAASPVAVTLQEQPQALLLDTGAVQVKVQREPLRVEFLRQGETLLREEQGFFRHDLLRGVRFALQAGEQLIGGGERVLGMNRRGYRLPLYNKPAYGYSAAAPVDQMYFGLPAVLSDRGYLLLWDNPARGEMDLGASETAVLQFQALTGRMAYLFVTGDSYADILKHYTAVTGRQPMPPRWALGNYASRFGYRSREQLLDVTRRFRDYRIPLDAVVLDIFWFGEDIQGHMGNLDWDRRHFPDPEGMLRDLAADGLHTVQVTEPFVLTSSRRWEEAVEAGVLARSPGGEAKRFDFYFGNTGLLDVFDPDASDWFWAQYRRLMDMGMSGIWGDLGEPELHPTDTLHRGGSADALHNAYGHRWAQLVFENHLRDYPRRRPVILMRSGFAGSQRFGMIPWTGDVLRDWSGLQAQVELALQMGLLGLAYTHSDLGGFAEGEHFDPELYLRWLQFGVFQPLFRPHAQEAIPPEPVFHGEEIARAARELVELRYRLMPYLYTMTWENARSGMPLARPLFFAEPGNAELFTDDRAFLWGPDLLVAPIVRPGVNAKTLYLPRGVWFNFWDGTRYDGGRELVVPVHPHRIPVFVRAGALLPMVPPVQRLRDYSSEQLTLHYYADATAGPSESRIYEDDGLLRAARLTGAHELLRFAAAPLASGGLALEFSARGGDYAGRPEQRRLTLELHNWVALPQRIAAPGRRALADCALARGTDCYEHDASAARLTLRLQWRGEDRRIEIL